MKNVHSILLVFLVSILGSQNIIAQPLRETRAVWLSTNYRLDWPPPTFNEEVQKQSLLEILDDIENKNLNTIYFQVRSNGSTLFKSTYEPFSPYITGQVDKMGGYDPLAFAVAEAHKRGLEIHAWINTMRCFNTSDLSILEHSNHVASKHSYWVYRKEESEGYSLWLNPGIPEVREYLVEVIDELVRNYDVDGVQLDFIRYPQEPINDRDAYSIYGHSKNIDDWRRENINSFVKTLSKRIRTTNPLIKLGATPIGIYKNLANARGLQGYSEVFQDSRNWLENGFIDYAVPQIYWNINDNPQFPVLVEDWTKHSYGKSVLIGLAAYREEVAKEIDQEIEIVRSSDSDGSAFFRYKHLRELTINSFPEKSLPTQMPWVATNNRLPKISPTISISNPDNYFVTLDWEIHDKTSYYSVYEFISNNSMTQQKLVKVIGGEVSSVIIPVSEIDRIVYSYAVKSVDKLWNECEEYDVISLLMPDLKNKSTALSKFDDPFITKLNGEFHLIVDSPNKDIIKISTSESNNLDSYELNPGLNSMEISSEFLEYQNLSIEFMNSGRRVELKK